MIIVQIFKFNTIFKFFFRSNYYIITRERSKRQGIMKLHFQSNKKTVPWKKKKKNIIFVQYGNVKRRQAWLGWGELKEFLGCQCPILFLRRGLPISSVRSSANLFGIFVSKCPGLLTKQKGAETCVLIFLAVLRISDFKSLKFTKYILF